jgi:hypothetical protein
MVGAGEVLRVVVVVVLATGADVSGTGWTSAEAPEAAGASVVVARASVGAGMSMVGAGLATGAGTTGCDWVVGAVSTDGSTLCAASGAAESASAAAIAAVAHWRERFVVFIAR